MKYFLWFLLGAVIGWSTDWFFRDTLKLYSCVWISLLIAFIIDFIAVWGIQCLLN